MSYDATQVNSWASAEEMKKHGKLLNLKEYGILNNQP